jgi:hypothetical protein
MARKTGEKIPFGQEHIRPKSISLSKIDLNLRNDRFGVDARSQNQALEFMFDVAGDKCLELLSDLCEIGNLNSSDIPIAVREGGRFCMLEGNRRLTCLKIWRYPSLLDELPYDLQEKFRKRIETIIKNSRYAPPNSIDVIIVDSVEDADAWIDKKHGLGKDGASTVEWDSYQKDRRLARKNNTWSPRYSFVTALRLDYEDDGKVVQELNRVIHTQYTTLSRILDNAKFKEATGVQYSEGGRINFEHSPEALRDFLLRILTDLASKEQNSSTLRPASKVSEYISGIISLIDETVNNDDMKWRASQSRQPDTSLGPSVSNTFLSSTVPETEKLDSTLPIPEILNYARKEDKNESGGQKGRRIFENLEMSSFTSKLQSIIKNTSKLSVNKNSDIISVMFRVILDLACYQYLEWCYNGKRSIPNDLDKRILCVLKDLDPNVQNPLKHAENTDPLSEIYHATTNDPNHLKLVQFAVHSSTYTKTANEVMILAERYQPMLVAMNEKMRENR